jgi:hypothetical protein
MTNQEADAFISSYRATLRAWSVAVSGFSADDGEALRRELEAGKARLAQIALFFPEKSYTVDMLMHARSRTWAGFTSERIARPPNRQT